MIRRFTRKTFVPPNMGRFHSTHGLEKAERKTEQQRPAQVSYGLGSPGPAHFCSPGLAPPPEPAPRPLPALRAPHLASRRSLHSARPPPSPPAPNRLAAVFIVTGNEAELPLHPRRFAIRPLTRRRHVAKIQRRPGGESPGLSPPP
jgi:hypothetical protein